MNIEDDADILVGYIATALDNKSWDKARAKIVEYLHKYSNEAEKATYNNAIDDAASSANKAISDLVEKALQAYNDIDNGEHIEKDDVAQLLFDSAEALEEQQKEIVDQQFKIDSLMLEYCPKEMTQDQIDNWEKHQVKSSVKIDGE